MIATAKLYYNLKSVYTCTGSSCRIILLYLGTIKNTYTLSWIKLN